MYREEGDSLLTSFKSIECTQMTVGYPHQLRTDATCHVKDVCASNGLASKQSIETSSSDNILAGLLRLRQICGGVTSAEKDTHSIMDNSKLSSSKLEVFIMNIR